MPKCEEGRKELLLVANYSIITTSPLLAGDSGLGDYTIMSIQCLGERGFIQQGRPKPSGFSIGFYV